MHSYENRFATGTSRSEDCRLGVAVGTVIAAYAGFFLVLYWLMQPAVSANAGLAGYRPPPKTVVRYADAPWVPPDPSEALPIRASDERAPVITKKTVTEEPKKEVKKPERRTAPRQAVRPAQQQTNPFWGFASSRSSGSRPWF
jgi:hypothetical protein